MAIKCHVEALTSMVGLVAKDVTVLYSRSDILNSPTLLQGRNRDAFTKRQSVIKNGVHRTTGSKCDAPLEEKGRVQLIDSCLKLLFGRL